MSYQRQDVSKYTIEALRTLGGQGKTDDIIQAIIDQDGGLTAEEVNFETTSQKSGKSYFPFRFDFNFGLRNLINAGYLKPYTRLSKKIDIVLTEKGRNADISQYPTAQDQVLIDEYWEDKKKLREAKAGVAESQTELAVESESGEEDSDDDWKLNLLEAIKQFSNGKFESFARLLVNKMGVKIDKVKGIAQSGDGGIDGFGYYESDEFRTSRVAIQAKRFTTGSVSSPDIDKFKGAMDKFGAEYGVFITTSFFTDSAIDAARQGSRLITLVDGNRITDLVEEYELHVTPVTTYTLDDYYFEDN